jgi:arylsulfatase A-like enzyme
MNSSIQKLERRRLARKIRRLQNYLRAGSPRSNLSLPIPHLALSIGSFLLALTMLSCQKQDVQNTEPVRRSVILISIDTLRADYLKLYAPGGAATPHLEQVAREGVTFRNVIAQVPYTLPSHCTMLTGMYPAAHRVRDNVRDVLPAQIPTIAQILESNGYDTAGFAGSMVLSRQTGIGRGFQFYDDFFSRADVHAEDLGGIERKADEVFRSFESWFNRKNSSNPFFAFIHFYDPHSPYQPPAGFSSSMDQKELYSGEIRYVDSVLGSLFSFLHQKGIWNETVVLVTSDHGEMLNEHGEIGHGFFLYQPALRVPLILKAAGLRPGESVNDLVQLVDIAPTLLAAAGLKPPPEMQGEDLLPVAIEKRKKKNRTAFAESYFASLQFGISPIRSIQDGHLKYIDAPQPELYDLASDPHEASNSAAERKGDLQQLKTKMSQYEKAYSKQFQNEERTVSAEQAEQFAALGYLGGQIPESKWDRSRDPKDFIDEWTASLEATALVEQRQFPRALSLINKISAASVMPSASLLLLESKCHAGLGDLNRAEKVLEPIHNTPEALTALANYYAISGRTAQAIQAYESAIKDHFSYFVLYNYALFLRQSGQKEKAKELVYREWNSRDDAKQTKHFFAEMFVLVEDWAKAEELLTGLIEERPWESRWYTDLATVYQSQGEMQKAVTLLVANQGQFSMNPSYLVRLGIIYNRAGLKREEVETFQRLVKVRPEDARGYFYLSKALLDTGQQTDSVIELTQRGFALNPDQEMQIFGHYILANAYEMKGRRAESREQFQIAEKLEKSLNINR